MKILLNVFLILILFNLKDTFAQKDIDKKQFRERIDSVMKQKLIENADMDTLTADRFIQIYNDNIRQIRKIIKEKQSLMNKMESDPASPDMGTNIDKLTELETNIMSIKKDFITELKTFLTPQQIAKTIIMRKNLQKVMRKEINKREKDKDSNELNEKSR